MRALPDGRSGSLGAGVLHWAERVLVIAGAAMLTWCGLLVIDGSLAQRAARRSLDAVSRSAPSTSPRGSDAAIVVPPRAAIAERGSALAELSVPRIGLSAVVLHGSDAQTLRRGPGHLEDTAFPGEPGNVVIAGHRDSFFRPLRNVQVGDDVFVDTPQARSHYRVTSLRVVTPYDVSVLEPTDTPVLTLITCYPFWVLGDAPDRFVVRAAAVADAPAPAFPAPITPAREPEPAPVVPVRAVKAPDASKDDATLVRDAIELFRLVYNARLAARNDSRPDGTLTFRTCRSAITDDQATASCEVASQSPTGVEPRVVTFTLEHADRGWAIRSIVMP
jgi:sortase A